MKEKMQMKWPDFVGPPPTNTQNSQGGAPPTVVTSLPLEFISGHQESRVGDGTE